MTKKIFVGRFLLDGSLIHFAYFLRLLKLSPSYWHCLESSLIHWYLIQNLKKYFWNKLRSFGEATECSVPKMSQITNGIEILFSMIKLFWLKISHLVENYFCFWLFAQPDESQAFENFATLKIRLLFKHLVSLLKCFFVVSIVQPVINRPKPPFSYLNLQMVSGIYATDFRKCEGCPKTKFTI